MDSNNEPVTKAMFIEGMANLKTELKTELTATLTAAFTAAITEAIDGLARLVNKGFADIEERMATKEELRAVDGRLSHAIGQVDNRLSVAIDKVDMHLSAYATQWNREFENVTGRLDEHDGRLRFLEKRRVG
ncbi:MAG: hypothetical protein ABSE18_03035 [Minisyncoccia bacterium]|jgi:hypothetical protein